MKLYLMLFVASVAMLLSVIYHVKKNNLNIHYSMVWIIWAIAMAVVSLFPQIALYLSRLLGIELASNAVFLLTIFMLYCMTFYVYLKISRHNEDIINLNYELAALKKTIEDLKKMKDRS